MKKTDKETVKKNITTGASSAIGSAIGVVAGVAVSGQEVEAAVPNSIENIPETIIDPEIEPTDDIIIVDVEEELQYMPEVEPETEIYTLSDPEPAVSVLETGTMTLDDGKEANFAIVNVNGTVGALIDEDKDGKADVAMIDLNHDGEISDDEVFDASQENIVMPSMQEPIQSDLYATNDMPDFVNDADAGTYMA